MNTLFLNLDILFKKIETMDMETGFIEEEFQEGEEEG